MRSTRALWLLFLATTACGTEPSQPRAAEPPTRSSAVTRWVAVRTPEDASILEAPAVVRAADARGVVSSATRVQIVRLRVQPGSQVEAGAPIVDVTAAEILDAAATYVGAGRGARMHRDRAETLTALVDQGLANRGQVFSRRAAAAALRAERDRAAAVLRSAGIELSAASRVARRGFLTLRAPIAGVVASLDAEIGETRDPSGGPIARIFGQGAFRVEVRTTQQWPAARSLRFFGNDGQRVALRVHPLSSVIDPDDGTRVSWYLPLAEQTLPAGLAGTVEVTAAEDVWEVPVTAVAQTTGQSELVRRRAPLEETVPVEVIGTSGASAWVRGALEDGDEVAANIRRLREDRP